MVQQFNFALGPRCASGQRRKYDHNIIRLIEDPVRINALHATMLYSFGMDHQKLTFPFGGLPIRLTNVGGKVVEKLFA